MATKGHCVLIIAAAAVFFTGAIAQASGNLQTNRVQIVELQGAVSVMLRSTGDWHAAQTNQFLDASDRVRTGPDSRVALRWSSESVMSFGAMTEMEILEPHSADAVNGLNLIRGITSFFHRDKPGRIRVITRGAVAGVEGTEFVLAVNEAGQSTISVIDGKVRFANDLDALVLSSGEQASAEPGKAPVRGTGFIANNLLQWALYYPVVLDPADLKFAANEEKTLADSLKEYRRGDVLEALANFPQRAPASGSSAIYHAALLLSVGQVEGAETSLGALQTQDVRANALQALIAAVKHQPVLLESEPKLTSELLARSYFEQSRAVPNISLIRALEYAKRATEQSPQSGYAWGRVAELEYGFGRNDKALAALNRCFEFTPRNPQATSLKGFVLLGENKPAEAMDWFDRALAVDAAMGNAWLGHGLCRIRMNDNKGGQDDLLIAAALEPQRAELRSYLGKAYATVNDYSRAEKELEVARRMDPNDPTSYLYSALVKRNENQINDAIRDLETSQSLNNNRSVYRSQLLLDQDQAVRSANLASIYRDAGMSDVAYREASRGVNYDYANYSAHLFLANSYNELINPTEITLRYETPRNIEYLLANLLAPGSAGVLTPEIALNENSKFFEHNRLGVVSDTLFLSRGAWSQLGEQYGVMGNFSYALDACYRSDPGERANEDVEQRTLKLTLKQQFTANDSTFLQVDNADIHAGDLHQYYSSASADRRFRLGETQEPNVVLGYHHEWNPAVHTLFVAGRFDDTFGFDGHTLSYLRFRPDVTLGHPGLTAAYYVPFHEIYTNKLTLYSAELQQIWETAQHNTVVGVRGQHGDNETGSFQDSPGTFGGAIFNNPASGQNVDTHLDRLSVYAYHNWTIVDQLQIVGGLTYDYLRFPENQTGPISESERSAQRLSPKAGLIWTTSKMTTVRFAYSRSIGDSSIAQSYQIEPSQVAGFQQAFRSVIPEDVASESPGAGFESFGLSVEQKFPTGTYLAVYGNILNSHVRRLVGAYDALTDEFDFAIPTGLRDKLDFDEKTLQLTANQLVGKLWSFGTQYRVSDATFSENFFEMPDHFAASSSTFISRYRNEAILHQVRLNANFNHPSGFFALIEGIWNGQSNQGYTFDIPGDDFWQVNIYGGYRFFHRRAEATLALLNVNDQDYHLNPLNIHEEFPHTRTLLARLRLSF
jgi:tetratricopeptide (TPR) repeat protein